jgi:hypothetical protein
MLLAGVVMGFAGSAMTRGISTPEGVAHLRLVAPAGVALESTCGELRRDDTERTVNPSQWESGCFVSTTPDYMAGR